MTQPFSKAAGQHAVTDVRGPPKHLRYLFQNVFPFVIVLLTNLGIAQLAVFHFPQKSRRKKKMTVDFGCDDSKNTGFKDYSTCACSVMSDFL